MKHLNKSGCRECGYNSKKLTLKSFIDMCDIIHNNFYDYSLVEYKHSKIKVKIVCPEHGIFEQLPSSHLNGQTCKKCVIDKFSLKIPEDFEVRESQIDGGTTLVFENTKAEGVQIRIAGFDESVLAVENGVKVFDVDFIQKNIQDMKILESQPIEREAGEERLQR